MGEVEVHALRGVDLDLVEAEFVVLLGPSGSGKSTLLNILGGLDTPTAGHVRLPRPRPHAAGEAELTAYRRHHVGFVFQFYNLIPSLTARENVALVTEIVARPDGPGGGAASWSAWATGSTTSPPSSPAASSSAWPSPAPSPSGPTCCCATSPPAPSTSPPASWCSRRSSGSTASSAPRTAVITHNAAIAAMADRVIRLSDGHIAADRDATRRSVSPRELQLVRRHEDRGPRPQAAPRPLADEGPGAGHRRGHRRRAWRCS